MPTADLVMPKMGESIMEATILKWHKKSGDAIAQDETLLDIATDKVDSEVPSTAAGIIAEILFSENDVVPIGTVIARIHTGGEATVMPATAPAQEASEVEAVPYTPAGAVMPNPQTVNTPRFYSPLVLNIAGQEGIAMTELESIPGTGNEGRVTKKDILHYVADKKAGKKHSPPSPAPTPPAPPKEEASATAPAPVHRAPATPKTYEGNVEIIEMDRMRKMIARHMVDSVQTSPHVTSFAEADVTNIVVWRDRTKKDFEKQNGTKLTFTPLFIDCLTRAIKRFPMVNASVDGDHIILRKDLNIGMATALPTGNLIVPVIRNADYLNLVGLSKQVNGLAQNARAGKLRPDDTQGGTFTLTNVGTFGSLMGTPIINQPQVAILAVGAIKKRPVVIETPLGDTIGIRHMMYLSLSYDHRIVDGSIGAAFLSEVARELEAWDLNREI